MPGLVVRVASGRGGDGGCAHQRFFASSWALKIPSGITLATGSPLSCCGVSGASPVAAGTGPAGTLLAAAVAARVRAATRRSRADGRRALAVPAASCPGVVRRAVVGAAQQVVDGLGAFQLGGVAAALPGQPSRDVVPGQFPERERDFPQVLPRAGDPAAGPADEHPGHVVGVVADLPQSLPGGDAGFLLPDRVQLRSVVGPVADLDAVGVDGPPDGGQQLDVVLGAERDRHVPGRLDQRGVLLVRRERPLRVQRVPQPVVGPVLPDRYEPFVEKVLHLHQGPQRLPVHVAAPPVGAAAQVAGGELAEQRAQRGEHLLDVRLVRAGRQVRRLDADPQVPAGRAEVVRDEHRPVVDDDGVRHDHRPGRGVPQPLVDAQQPVIGQGRVRHRQAGRPPGPHRLGRERAGQQHARVDRLRRGAQHRGGHRPGCHVDHPGQLHPSRHPVVQQHHDVQGRGVDLHQLARRRRVSLREHPLRPARQAPAGDRGPGRVPARRQPGEQPEHRGPRRLLARLAPLGQQLPGAPDDERRRPRRIVGRLGDRLLHRPGDRGIGPAGRAAALRHPPVHQPGQALGLPPLPPVLDRGSRNRPVRRGQLGGLGPLALAQGGALHVIFRTRRGPGGRVRAGAVHDLDDVGLPPPRPLDHLRRQPGQPDLRTRAAARLPRLQPQPAAARQLGDRRLLDDAVVAGEPDRRPRCAQHHLRPAVDDDAVPGPDPFRPGQPAHPAAARHVTEAPPSRTDRSQLSSRRHSR